MKEINDRNNCDPTVSSQDIWATHVDRAGYLDLIFSISVWNKISARNVGSRALSREYWDPWRQQTHLEFMTIQIWLLAWVLHTASFLMSSACFPTSWSSSEFCVLNPLHLERPQSLAFVLYLEDSPVILLVLEGYSVLSKYQRWFSSVWGLAGDTFDLTKYTF